KHHAHAEQPRSHVHAVIDLASPREDGGEARSGKDQPHEGACDARQGPAPLPQEPHEFTDDDAVHRAHAQLAPVWASSWPVRARNTSSSEATPATRLSAAGVSSAASRPRSITATRSHGSASSTERVVRNTVRPE